MNAAQYKEVSVILNNSLELIRNLTGMPGDNPFCYGKQCFNKEVRAFLKKELQLIADDQIIQNPDEISENPKEFRKYNELIKAMIVALED